MRKKLKINLQKNKGQLEASDDNIEYIRGFFYDKQRIYTKGKRREVTHYHVTPTGKFNVGYYPQIRDKLRDEYDITLSEEFSFAWKPALSYTTISEILGFTYYDYQRDSIACMLKYGRGVVEIGTSGGKSLIQAGFCKTVMDNEPSKRILIIVPGLSLIGQLYDSDFCGKYGMREYTTVLTSTRIREYDSNKRIVICNSECITNIFKNDKENIYKDFDYILVDEVHTVNKNTLMSSVMDRCETPNKYGFTGSMPDVGVDYYNIIGHIGSIIYSKNAKSLRMDNFVANLRICVAELSYDKGVRYTNRKDGKQMYLEEKEFVITHTGRNNFIEKLVRKFDNSTLILVDRIEHGERILDTLKQHGHDCVFIRGATSGEERQRIQKYMETAKNVKVVAMDRIFSTGISVNNIHHVVFACIGVSKIKILQSIGRGLRKNHNKNHVTVYDISDNLLILNAQKKKRLALYQQEVDNIQIKQFKI